MNFISFRNTFQDYTIFSTREIAKIFPGFDRKILVAWQKKGYLKKVRNSWYYFADTIFKEADLRLIANKIYHPSYISLESALAHYQFIPEGVFRFTSVSTLKTTYFDTPIGFFNYQNLKRKLFWGYRLERQLDAPIAAWYKIATPEKAILDFLYLNSQYQDEADFESLRFNWLAFSEQVNMKTLNHYLAYIQSNALEQRLHSFLNFHYAQS